MWRFGSFQKVNICSPDSLIQVQGPVLNHYHESSWVWCCFVLTKVLAELSSLSCRLPVLLKNSNRLVSMATRQNVLFVLLNIWLSPAGRGTQRQADVHCWCCLPAELDPAEKQSVALEWICVCLALEAERGGRMVNVSQRQVWMDAWVRDRRRF